MNSIDDDINEIRNMSRAQLVWHVIDTMPEWITEDYLNSYNKETDRDVNASDPFFQKWLFSSVSADC